MNDVPYAVPILVTLAACVVCAVTDLRHFRVPNLVTVPLLTSGIIYHASIDGWPGVKLALWGCGFGFAVLLIPHLLGGMGAGDVKLLGGIGAWLGRPVTYDVLIAAVIFAGLYSLFLVSTTGSLRKTWNDIRSLLARGLNGAEMPVRQAVNCTDRHNRLVPFAAMIALGLVVTLIRN